MESNQPMNPHELLVEKKIKKLADFVGTLNNDRMKDYLDKDHIKRKLFANNIANGDAKVIVRLFLCCLPNTYDAEKAKDGPLAAKAKIAPYGPLTHAGVQINNLTVNLYAPGLVAIDGFRSSSCFFLFSPMADRMEIPYTDEIAEKVVDIIVRWNGEYGYDEFKTNCQHFADELVKTLVPNYSLNGLIGAYIQDLINGTAIEKEADGSLVYHVKICNGVELKFKDHRDLDLQQQQLGIEHDSPEGKFLKAFHRGFQARCPAETCFCGYSELTIGAQKAPPKAEEEHL